MTNQDHKRKAVELMKSVETGERGPLSFINPDMYIQHNLAAANGKF
ncbi:MAG TPA: hypothetical protein VF338_12270 [Leptolinea sp.]